MNVPSIQWLDIRSRDVLAGNGQDDYNGLLRLSARDRKKATDMLERSEVLREDGKEEEWRRELQAMLMLNVKAEMEILAEREGGVKGWVEEKLLEHGTGLDADEDMLETHHLAHMTLDDSPSLQANEELLLDETAEMSAHGEGTPSTLADEDLLDTNQAVDSSLADEGSLTSPTQLGENLLEKNQSAGTPLSEGISPSLEWDEEL